MNHVEYHCRKPDASQVASIRRDHELVKLVSQFILRDFGPQRDWLARVVGTEITVVLLPVSRRAVIFKWYRFHLFTLRSPWHFYLTRNPWLLNQSCKLAVTRSSLYGNATNFRLPEYHNCKPWKSFDIRSCINPWEEKPTWMRINFLSCAISLKYLREKFSSWNTIAQLIIGKPVSSLLEIVSSAYPPRPNWHSNPRRTIKKRRP